MEISTLEWALTIGITCAVLLTFNGAPNAVSYNAYRRAAANVNDPLVLVNSTPSPYTWIIDDGAGKGLTIGFTQLALSSAFPQEVQEGMEEQAKIAGLTLLTCDSNLEGPKALECAGVAGVVVQQLSTLLASDESIEVRIWSAFRQAPPPSKKKRVPGSCRPRL